MSILVFNIKQNTDVRVLTRGGHLLNIKYLQSRQEWLTSIIIIDNNTNQDKIIANIDNGNVEYTLPFVILVASHDDCITGEQDEIDRFIECERLSRTLTTHYKSNIYSSRIIVNCNPDDNSIAALAARG